MPVSCPQCALPVPDGQRFCGSCGSPASPLSPPGPAGTGGGPPPSLPPRYSIVSFLGRGGMGRVYLCKDAELDVEVAVKVLPHEVAADGPALEQIRTEARAAAKFRSCPGILHLYGFEQHGDTRYLVMEYAPGGSLLDRLRKERRIPESECRRLGAEVADALAFAHRGKVLHRDIKPANVLLDGEGHAKVADFGIARLLSAVSARISTAAVAGTPAYMAPEGVLRQETDARADLYSLGCMLYEMSTGAVPFEGTFAEIAMAKTAPEAAPPDPREREPGLSAEFASVVRRLLAPRPADRFPDADSAADALRGAATLEAVHAVAPPPPAPPKSRGGKIKIAIPGGVALILLFVFAVFALPKGRTPPGATGDRGPPPRDAIGAAPSLAGSSPPPVAAAVPGLPPPPSEALRLAASLALPAGVLRGADGRLWSERDGAELVAIPEGTFSMGDDGSRRGDDRPAHPVRLSAFLLDRHEVTVGQVRRYAEATKAIPVPEAAPDATVPAMNLTWDEAAAYAAWAGGRLPTEAEWERAARGLDGRPYPWGKEEPSTLRANFFGAGFVGATPAGFFPMGASPTGCYDLAGNAMEWCADWYDASAYAGLPAGPVRDPKGPDEGTLRSVRGGAWYFRPELLRSSARLGLDPGVRVGLVGFRIARGLP